MLEKNFSLEQLKELEKSLAKEGKFSEVVSVLERKIQLDPSKASDYYYEIGNIYREHIKNQEMAIKAFQKSISIKPDSFSSFQALRSIFLAQENWEQYLLFGEKQLAFTSDPQQIMDLHFSLADIYTRLNMPEKAHDHLMQVYCFDPCHLYAFEKLCAFYKKTQRWQEYAKILENHLPGNTAELVVRFLEIADTYFHRLKNYKEAILFYEKAHLLSPFTEEILVQLQKAAVEGNNPEKRVYSLEKRVELCNNPEAKYALLMELGEAIFKDEEKAILVYEKAYSQKPKSLEVLDILSKLYISGKKDRELFSCLGKKANLLSQKTDLENIWLNLAELAHNKLHDNTNAIVYYEKLLVAYPEKTIPALLALYQENKEWYKLAALYEKIYSEKTQEEKIEILRKLAFLYEEVLKKDQSLKDCLYRLLCLQSLEKKEFPKLERLAREQRDWTILLAVLEEKAKHIHDSQELSLLYQQAAQIYHHELGNDRQSIEYYRKAWDQDRNNEKILQELQFLYIFKKDYENAFWAIEERLKRSKDSQSRFHLLMEKGIFLRDCCQKNQDASLALEQALELMPSSREAIDSLEGIYCKEEKFHEWISVLLKKQSLVEKREKIDISLKIAFLYEEKIKDDANARQILESCWKNHGFQEDIFQQLRRFCYKHKDWNLLQRIYQEAIAQVVNTEHKAQILFACGKFYEQNKIDASQAALYYLQALALKPGYINAIRSLQKIYENENKHQSLVESYLAELAVLEISPSRRVYLHIQCGQLFFLLNKHDGAIQHYKQALKLDSNNLFSIRKLEEIYRIASEKQELLQLLLTEMRIERKEIRLFEVYKELGYLYRDSFQNPQESIQNFIKAHRYFPKEKGVLEDLKNLLIQENRWEEYALYMEEEEDATPFHAKQRHQKLAEVYKKLQNNEKLIYHLEKILLYPPYDLKDVLLLEELYQKQGEDKNSSKLLSLYTIENSLTTDIPRQKELLLKRASLYFQAEKEEDAISCLEKILKEDILHKDAFSLLSKVYIKKQMWSELGNLYVRFAYSTKDQKAREDLLLKAGTIWEKKANNTEKAMGYYYQILVMNPKNSTAGKAILKILDHTKDWHTAIEILQRQANGLEGKEKATLLFKIAQIWEIKIKDIVQALKAYLNMLETHFHLETAEHILPLLQAAKDYESLALVLKKMIRNTQDSAQKAEKYLELGNLLFYEFQKTSEAVKAYKKVLKHNPQKIEALSSLEEIYTQEQEWEELCAIKEKKLEMASNPGLIQELHLQLGELYHKRIYNQKKAIFHYESAMELQEEACVHCYPLEELYKEWGYFDKYIALAEKEIESQTNLERKKMLLSDIAYVWEKNLFEPFAAIKNWEKILEMEQNNKDAIENLIRLYESNLDYANLVRVFKRKEMLLDNATALEKKDLYLVLARLYFQKLSCCEDAIEYYNKVLLIDSENREALFTLEEIAEKSQDKERLEPILKKRIELCSQQEEKFPLYCRLGNLYWESSPQKASEYYEMAHQCQPSDLAILNALQKLYQRQNDPEKTLKTNARILALTSQEDQKILLYIEVAELLSSKSHENAIEYLEKVLTFKPDHKEALSLLGKLFVQTKQWEKAKDVYNRWISIEKNPEKQISALEQRGKVYWNLGDKEKTAQDWAKVFESQPDNLDMALSLSGIYHELGDLAKAQAIYDLIIHWPDRAKIKTALCLADLYFESGEIAYRLNKKEMALLRYLQALQIDPEHKKSIKKLAQMYYDNMQWEESMLLFMKYKSLYEMEEPEKKEILWVISAIKEKMGMAQGAIEGYMESLQSDPENPCFMESLGYLYWENKEAQKALEYLIAAEKRTSDQIHKQKLLEKIALVYESQENHQSAFEIYERLLQYSPYKAEYLQKAATLCQRLKDWKNAEKYILIKCEKSEKEVQKADCYCLLGSIYRDGYQDEEKAISFFQKALEVVPAFIPAFSSLVLLYNKSEEWQSLKHCYEKFLGSFPSHRQEEIIPFLLEEANMVWERLGDIPEAIQLYKKILEIAPDHKTSHIHLSILCRQYPEKRDEAILEHRYIVSQDPFRSHSYHELFSMYREQNEYDRAYLCCMNLSALEKISLEEKKFLSQIQPRVSSGWLDSTALDSLIHEHSRGTLYEIMASLDPFMDKIYTVPEEEYAGKQRLSLDSDQRVENVINNILRVLQITDISVYLINKRKILLENTQPASLFLGKDFLKLNAAHLYFLLGRSLFYVSRNQIMAAKLSPEDYYAYTLRIVEAFAETGKKVSWEEEALSRKIRNALPKRLRKPWEERMDIFTEIYNANTKDYQKALEIAANRCGLLLSDSLPDSCYAYLLSQDKEKGIENFHHTQEIKEMFWFNISDEISTLRKELGIDVKWINKARI
ncbi:MAG: tetratricopeptide repeat protein [Candidatus Brocadiae bacterium]|nr:tetratricopeptide repeat protein [Candidatus Brocadiia bacterium]